MSKETSQPVVKYDSIFSLLVRVFWMLLGNAILLMSVIFILQGGNWKFHTADVVFWVTVAALLLARYLDIKFFGECTSTGALATISHWRRYAVILLICSVVVWILSHATNYLNK